MNNDFTVTDTKESECPSCGEILCAAAGSRQPSAGDFSVCQRCANVMIFNADLSLRQPTAAELAYAQANHDIAGAIDRIKTLINPNKAPLH